MKVPARQQGMTYEKNIGLFENHARGCRVVGASNRRRGLENQLGRGVGGE